MQNWNQKYNNNKRDKGKRTEQNGLYVTTKYNTPTTPTIFWCKCLGQEGFNLFVNDPWERQRWWHWIVHQERASTGKLLQLVGVTWHGQEIGILEQTQGWVVDDLEPQLQNPAIGLQQVQVVVGVQEGHDTSKDRNDMTFQTLHPRSSVEKTYFNTVVGMIWWKQATLAKFVYDLMPCLLLTHNQSKFLYHMHNKGPCRNQNHILL